MEGSWVLWDLSLGVGLAGSVPEEEVSLRDFFWRVLLCFCFVLFLSLIGKKQKLF